MPVYDCICETCGTEKTNMMIEHWDDKAPCPKCSSDMKKLPPVVNFKINGYNYKNGYS